MDKAITLEMYLKLTGIAVTAVSIVVAYWVSEVRDTKKATAEAKKLIEDHKSDDEKEFYEAQRSNDAIHADLRREMGQVKGSAELAVAGLKGDMGAMNGKLDTLIGLFTDLIKNNK